jgi:hypothetical protein
MKDEENIVKYNLRIPKYLYEKLCLRANENRRSVNNEIIMAITSHVAIEWWREHVVMALKKTALEITSLQERIAEYAASRSISVDQASDELGISALIDKALAEIEAIDKDRPPKAKPDK